MTNVTVQFISALPEYNFSKIFKNSVFIFIKISDATPFFSIIFLFFIFPFTL